MTKTLLTALFCAFVALTVGVNTSHAADKKEAPAAKEVTVKGTMMCAKCSLKETTACQNVLKASEGGKDVKYYLVQNPVAKDGHGKVCGGTAAATVKGTVAEEGGKKMLTASEIKYE